MTANLIGFPKEVSIYHPAEFLELQKSTLAFLDVGLSEIKTSPSSQLLVAHIMGYVQENGIDALKSISRHKESFTEDLINKTREKMGIELTDLLKRPIIFDKKRVEVLSGGVSPYKPNDLFEAYSNIYISSNYSMFHFLDFNRNIINKHVNKLILSIKKHGVLSFPTVVYTNCIDGVWRYYILDGQHRFKAFVKLGLPIRFTLYTPEPGVEITKYDLVRLIADLNKISKTWPLKQYLATWNTFEIREYKKINNVYNRTKISLTTLLQAYSGVNRKKAVELFMDGLYQMSDEENGNSYVEYLIHLKPLIPKSTGLYTALLNFFRQKGSEYDNKKMMMVLKRSLSDIMGKDEEKVLENLLYAYDNYRY